MYYNNQWFLHEKIHVICVDIKALEEAKDGIITGITRTIGCNR